KKIFADLDDERRARLRLIRSLECELAGLLVQTPYVLLLSFPGINVVTAAELAGEMGPIENYPSDGAITGRAALFPARYQRDRVDHDDGPLVRRANHTLRYILLLIAENLLLCNGYFRGLGRHWQAQGVDPRVRCVRVAKRFCRIAYRMVAGRQVFRHPSCPERQKHPGELIPFHCPQKSTNGADLGRLAPSGSWIPSGRVRRGGRPVPGAPAPQARPRSRRCATCRPPRRGVPSLRPTSIRAVSAE